MLLLLIFMTAIGTLGMWTFSNRAIELGFEEMEVHMLEGTVLWGVDDLGVTLEEKVIATGLQGISMDRKQEIFEDDSDASIQKLVDHLMKDGVLR